MSSAAQISVSASFHATTMSWSTALAVLLQAASPAQLAACSVHARCFLYCFLHSSKLISSLRGVPRAERLVQILWQRVTECPSALSATVEALQLSETNASVRRADIQLVAEALALHVHSPLAPETETAWSPALLDLLASGILQRYAMEVLAEAASAGQLAADLKEPISEFASFLAWATAENKMDEAVHRSSRCAWSGELDGKAFYRCSPVARRYCGKSMCSCYSALFLP